MNLDELFDESEIPKQTPPVTPPEDIVKDNREDSLEGIVEYDTGNTTPVEASQNSLDEIFARNGIPKKTPPKQDSDVGSDNRVIRENTRRGMAYILLSLLSVTVAGVLLLVPIGRIYFISQYPEKDVEKILDKDTINLIWTSQVTLLGTVLGFYFGSQNNSRDDD